MMVYLNMAPPVLKQNVSESVGAHQICQLFEQGYPTVKVEGENGDLFISKPQLPNCHWQVRTQLAQWRKPSANYHNDGSTVVLMSTGTLVSASAAFGFAEGAAALASGVTMGIGFGFIGIGLYLYFD